MAEWYRTGWTYLELMQELESIVKEVIGDKVRVAGKDLAMTPPFSRITVAEAMARAGADLSDWENLSPKEWQERFHRAFTEKLEPWLADQGALFLTDFPARAALLARTRPDDPGLAERFELIIAGFEIANGCTELIDPQEHRRRMQRDREIRRQNNKTDRQLPPAFIADLESPGLPECAGVALGVERLAMIATGASRIEEVQAFPFAE